MIITSTIKELIIDQKIGEIREFIADGREQYGMQTFDQHLADLVTSGTVSFETALAASTRPSDFELQMSVFKKSNMPASGFGSGGGGAGGTWQ
jgi:twitching motility protein PilT